ncbi:seryl-tRNA synthetase [Parelusimicrobium proximum]|uniref:serine--tRNA ligase n=1 Tax=Parelusimicrobium proximum TaxID=3228953 RepID=UPI003D17F5DB
MLDIKLINANTEEVKKSLAKRNPALAENIDKIQSLNAEYKKLLNDVEAARAKRNELSKSIRQMMKADPAGAEKAKEEVARIKEEMQAKETEMESFKTQIDDILLSTPNMPDESVKVGKNAADNTIVKESQIKPKDFSFKPSDHHAVGEKLGILDFEAAATLSGSRFALLKGDGAKLERAIINFMLDRQTSKGYTEIMPPVIVNEEILVGTGQLPKFREDMYELAGEPKQFLISTAEIPLTNLNRGKMLAEKDLPLKYTAGTACFRKEAGTYGKDTRGLIRNHQFNKVELVMLSDKNNSFKLLEQMTADAEDILATLGLAYRIVELCTGDMGFSSAKTYDLEVWMPGENAYREISSCSNCTDFQARRMGLRYKNTDGKPEFVHTLNGSSLAVGRTFAAILENCQQEDGSVLIPKALVPYFGKDRIEAK